MAAARAEPLNRAVARATEALLARRTPDRLWSDFKTEAGRSDEWVSGFVAYAVSQNCNIDRRIEGTLNALAARQRKVGGWAYNRSIPPDCDSTAWVLMALSAGGARRPSVVLRALRFLASHQDPLAGGFATYCQADAIARVIGATDETSLGGWLNPQPCVTGLALLSILVHGESVEAPAVQSAANYLLGRRGNSGTWPAYWWKGHAYSTFICLSALWAARRLSRAMACKSVAQLSCEQREDGGWAGDPGGDSEVFATAFNLLSLFLFPEVGTLERAQRGIVWLLEQQTPEGTWRSAPILHIPRPFAVRPNAMSDVAWRAVESGTLITVADPDAIYTTAAAIWALSAFRALVMNS